MALPTALDWHHAALYSRYVERRTRFALLQNEYPHVFGHATWKDVGDPLVPSDRMPPTAKVVPRKYTITFDRVGCEQISCYSSLTGGSDCSKTDPARWMYCGDSTSVMVCQPSCFGLNTFSKNQPLPPDVRWSEKKRKCVYDDTYVKKYASDPSCRWEKPTIGITNLPRGFEYDAEEGSMKINASYCDYFGADYDGDSRCVVSWWQEHIVENVLGTTVFRAIKRMAKGHALFVFDSDKAGPRWDTSKPVPDNLKSEAAWLANVPSDVAYAATDLVSGWRKTVEEKGKSIKDFFERIDWKEFGHTLIEWNTIKDILISVGVDMAPRLAKKLAAKTLGALLKTGAGKAMMAALKAAGKKVVGKIVSTVLANAVVRSVASAAAKFAAKLMALGSSVVGWVLIVFSIVQFLLDLWDPYNLKNQTDQNVLDKTSEKLRHMMDENVVDAGEALDRELGGDVVMAIVCLDMPPDHAVARACTEAETAALTEFIMSLKHNSIGQLTELGSLIEVDQDTVTNVSDPTDYLTTGIEDADDYDAGYVPTDFSEIESDPAWWQYLFPATAAATGSLLAVCAFTRNLAMAAWIVVGCYMVSIFVTRTRIREMARASQRP